MLRTRTSLYLAGCLKEYGRLLKVLKFRERLFQGALKRSCGIITVTLCHCESAFHKYIYENNKCSNRDLFKKRKKLLKKFQKSTPIGIYLPLTNLQYNQLIAQYSSKKIIVPTTRNLSRQNIIAIIQCFYPAPNT